jgi:outer membrane receptor protein involved in Fe transport
VYNVVPAWSLSTNLARSYRSPDFTELFYDSPSLKGNKDLKPETAWTYDLGSRVRLGQVATFDLTGFYTDMQDRIAVVGSNFVNIANAEIAGVEAAVRVTLPRVRSELSYTHQRARGNTAARSEFVPLLQTPEDLATALIDWNVAGGLSLINTAHASAEQFEQNDHQGKRAPGYLVWNARLEQRVKSVTFFAGVDNITDEHYAESFNFDSNTTFETTLVPQPGRAYRGGVSIRWPFTEEK